MNAAFSCPHCGYPAAPAWAAQTCGACRRVFALYPGAAGDPSVAPPMPTVHTPSIQVRSAGAFEYRFALLEPMGISEGTLDPIIAQDAMVKGGVAWPDIVSVAVWRKLDVVELFIAVLIPLPIALMSWIGVLASSAGFLFLAVPFTLLAAFMLYRAIGRRKNFARIVGRYGMITVRFDRPGWRRLRFHAELLRRAGLRDMPIP